MEDLDIVKLRAMSIAHRTVLLKEYKTYFHMLDIRITQLTCSNATALSPHGIQLLESERTRVTERIALIKESMKPYFTRG